MMRPASLVRLALALLVVLGTLGTAFPQAPRARALVPTLPTIVTTDQTAGATAAGMATALQGPGILSIANAAFTGAPAAGGTFTGGTGIIGFEKGTVLSTGKIADTAGPNTVTNRTTNFALPGDAALNALATNPVRADAAVLNFDFVPNGNQIEFQYVFGSEEYNEYVNSGFNDVFAMFVNGTNCALVNGQPVSINTINRGTTGTDPITAANNGQFFINNAGNVSGTGTSGAPLNTQLDGLTTVLTCRSAVNPGVSNHLKIAIEDVGDGTYDSAIFLQFQSLRVTGPVAVAAVSGSGATGGSTTLTATLQVGTAPPQGLAGQTISFSVSGTAVGNALTDVNGVATLTVATSTAGGIYPNAVTAAFAGNAPYAAASGSGTLTITPVPDGLSAVSGAGTYGSTATLTATLQSGGAALPGKTVAFTLNGMAVGTAVTNGSGVATLAGVSLAGVNAGTYPGAVRANFAGDATYAASSGTGDLTVAKATTTLTLSNLTQAYDGAPKSATATTAPAGLSGVSITYSQGGVAVAQPTNVGSYDVVATLTNPNYTAPNATGVLVITRAADGLTGVAGSGTYGGTGSLTATLQSGGTALAGRTVTFTLGGAAVGSATTNASGVATLSGVGLGGRSAGTYAGIVGASFAGDATYLPSSGTGDLTVAKAAATLTLSNLNQTYDGTPKSATVTTTPAGLTGVSVTYSQAGVAVSNPTLPGSYDVVATLTNANYTATNATGVLVIAPATAGLSSVAGSGTYGGTGTLTATLRSGTAPLAGQTVTFALNGATVGTATTDASGVATLSGVSLAGVPAGTFPGAVTASFAGSALYAATSATGPLTVAKAAAALTLSGLTQPYDGTPKSATVTTSPAGLSGVNVTYSQGGVAVSQPTLPGTYNVVATLTNPNYTAPNAAGTLTIVAAADALMPVAGSGTYGGTGTLTATLKANGAALSGKTVAFTLNGAAVGSATTDANGVATLSGVSLAGVPAGTAVGAVGASFAGDATYLPSNGTGDLAVAKAAATITLSNLNQPYDGTPKSATATTNPAGLSGVTITYSQAGVAVSNPTLPGSYDVVATLANGNYAAPNATGVLVIAPSPDTLSAVAGSGTYGGSGTLTATLRAGATPLTGKSVTFTLNGATVGSATTDASGVATLSGVSLAGVNAGSYPGAVGASFAGDAIFAPATATGDLAVAKATASIALTNTTATYDGTPKAVTATTTPSGLSGVAVTYSQGGVAVSQPTAGGTYDVVATLTNPNYTAPNATGTLVIAPAADGITAVSGSGTYGGTATLTATLRVGSTPVAGKTLTFSLNGTAVGTAVTAANGVATLGGVSLAGVSGGTATGAVGAAFAGDASYAAATGTGDLTVARAAATIALSNLNQPYDGTPKAATATTNPAGLSGVTITYSQAGIAVTNPTLPGNYDVVATLTNGNYTAPNATGVLTITPAVDGLSGVAGSGSYNGTGTLTATLRSAGTALANKPINFTLNGAAVGTATTDANGTATLGGVALAGIPVGTATGAVMATFAGDAIYAPSSGTGDLTVAKAAATITLAGLNQTYDGTPKAATATTNPAGLSGVTITYSQGGVAVTNPTLPGSYDVVATLTNGSYAAPNATGVLVINPAADGLTAVGGSGTYGGTGTLTATLRSGGTPLPNQPITFTLNGAAVGTATTDVNGVATLTGVALTGVNAGTAIGAIGAAFAGEARYLATSGTGDLTVAKAVATITLANLMQMYDGTPKSATATTAPAGLSGVTLAYRQGGVAVAQPTNAGSYDVVATLTNPNYTAPNATGVLVISPATSNGLLFDRPGAGATFPYSPGGTFVVRAVPSGNTAPITYTVAAGSTCTIASTPNADGSYTVTMTGAGPCTINAAQPAQGNYAATSGQRVFTITPAAQTITFPSLPDRAPDSGPFTLQATTDSGLPITYTARGACTVSGSTVTRTGDGTCTITASQPGNANYAAAASVARTFTYGTPGVILTLVNADGTAGVATLQPTGVATGVTTTRYPVGTVVTVAPQPAAGTYFVRYAVDGVDKGWANPMTITMDADHTVTLTSAAIPAFSDVGPDAPYRDAILNLAARGIVRGYGDGSFGPGDHALRAQMAALIARALGWDAEARPNPFPDRCVGASCVDDNLWRNIGTLAGRDVARGYPNGMFYPLDDVLHVQVVSFITRGMVAKGYWTYQPDDATIYPNIPATSGHRVNVATYVHYAGMLPDRSANTTWADWSTPSTRQWFAAVLWQALDSYFGRDTVDPDGFVHGGYIP